MSRLFGDDCRRNYPDAARCICRAEGHIVHAQALSLRSMNFGQHWRTEGIREVSYSVEIPHRFWLDVVARELPEFVDDAMKFPSDDDKLEAELRVRGWPSSLDDKTALDLAPLWVRYFDHDLLLEWLGDGPPDEHPGWVVNTIESIVIEADRVRFTGTARTTEIPVRYQDV